ncbi:hypothetical protein ACNITI_27290, partial [Escherichia coli]
MSLGVGLLGFWGGGVVLLFVFVLVWGLFVGEWGGGGARTKKKPTTHTHSGVGWGNRAVLKDFYNKNAQGWWCD